MARVLVTGGTGFIGRHLVEALVARGDEVTCLVRASSSREALEPLGVDFAVGDVSDEASMRAAAAPAEVVYHLAAMLKAPWRPDFMTTNADGVRVVARACAGVESPPVLLTVSSISAAGPSGGAPLTEADVPRPVSKYGRSKLFGEQAARELAERVPITIVRPPVVFGERDRTSFPLFQTAARGWHVLPAWRDGDRVSMIHVEDLVAAIIAAGERGERLPARPEEAPPGMGVYFAAADEAPTVREMGELIAGAVGARRLRVLRAPAALTLLTGAAGEAIARLRDRASIVNYDKMVEATAGSWTCSTDKARRQLDFRPAHDLAARLEQTAAWYRSANWL
jgi:dihydroflavonol-4-reductase